MSHERRLRVLFLTAWFPSAGSPLDGVFVREHAKAAACHDEVVVVHLAGPRPGMRRRWHMEPDTDDSRNAGIPTYRLWYRPSAIPKASSAVQAWSVSRALGRLADEGFRPDIVHAHIYQAALPAVLVGRSRRLPVVVTEQMSAFPLGLLTRRELRKARIAFHLAHAVLPVSEALGNALVKQRLCRSFRVVPNVVDTDVFYPSTSHSTREPCQLLFVGRLDASHVKGVPELIEALAGLPADVCDWRLHIIGDGPSRPAYEEDLRERGLVERVLFHGVLPKDEVAEHMRSADLFVLPSRWDNMPCALLEAQACGLPAVASRVGGIPEVMDDASGVLTPPRAPLALRDGIVQVLRALDRYDRSAIASRARRFGTAEVGRALSDIYREYV